MWLFLGLGLISVSCSIRAVGCTTPGGIVCCSLWGWMMFSRLTITTYFKIPLGNLNDWDIASLCPRNSCFKWLLSLAFWVYACFLGFTVRAHFSMGLLLKAAAAAAKSLQSCLTLCDPIDGSPSGFPVPGILQAKTLEWVAISFSSAWEWKVKVKLLSRVRPLATPWTATFQAPPSMGFSRQEYWSGLPLPSPEKKWIG